MKFSNHQTEKIVKKVSADSSNLHTLVNSMFNGHLKALEIKNFLGESVCGNLVETATQYAMDKQYLNGKAAKILESQHNRQSDPDGYFEGIEDHGLLNEPIFRLVTQKVQRLLEASGKKVNVAYDPVRKKFYCPAIIREFHSTLKLHNDNAKREATGWNPIQNVKQQIAFVIKLTNCSGGQTIWYPRPWTKEDEIFFNTDDNYSYDEKVVEGYPECVFEGVIGTLILFDSKCYHKVEPVTAGRRYTMGGFIGLLEESEELVIWS